MYATSFTPLPRAMSEREAALKLVSERDALEREIFELRDALSSHGVGMEDPLVTSDGFPRHDVDVHAIRNIRVQLIRKQNDMHSLMRDIGAKLQHAFPKRESRSQTDQSTNHSASRPARTAASPASTFTLPKPFAVIRSVVSGALGAEAGLEADDYLVQFGDTKALADLPAELKRFNGKMLPITILRGGELQNLEIFVAPDRALGAHITPL